MEIALALDLDLPRLISFESDCASGSARHGGATSAVSHGWLQALSTCTSTLKIPKEPRESVQE